MVDPESERTITLDLPWPPTANRYWRNVNGRMVLSRGGMNEVMDGGAAELEDAASYFRME